MTVWVQNVRHVEESGRTVSTAPSWHTPRRTEMLLYRRHCEYVLERACVCLCACVWKERKGTSQGVNRNASALIEGCHADPLGACLSLTHTYTHTHSLSEPAGVCFLLFRIYWRACRAPSRWLRSWKANWTTWCDTPETWAHSRTGSQRLSNSTTGERSLSALLNSVYLNRMPAGPEKDLMS